MPIRRRLDLLSSFDLVSLSNDMKIIKDWREISLRFPSIKFESKENSVEITKPLRASEIIDLILQKGMNDYLRDQVLARYFDHWLTNS